MVVVMYKSIPTLKDIKYREFDKGLTKATLERMQKLLSYHLS